MLNTPLLRALSIVLVTGLSSACTLSPQKVDIAPTLETPSRALDAGRSVAIEVIDKRADPIIGTRGGVYADTSTISSRGDPTAGIREALRIALRGYGIASVEDARDGAARVTVALEQLEYVATGKAFVSAVAVSATVSVVCRRDTRTYEARYRAKNSKRVAMAPNEEANEQLINAVLSEVLGRLVTDQKLLDLLVS